MKSEERGDPREKGGSIYADQLLARWCTTPPSLMAYSMPFAIAFETSSLSIRIDMAQRRRVRRVYAGGGGPSVHFQASECELPHFGLLERRRHTDTVCYKELLHQCKELEWCTLTVQRVTNLV